MAARKRNGLSENTRQRIKTSMLVNRLTEHALSEEEIMTASQVNAARVLLNKTLPDLQAVTLTGEDGGPVQIQDVTRLVEAEEILRRYGIDPDEIT